MDSTMRDLNLIRERGEDPDSGVRRYTLFGMAGGVVVLLVLGLCLQLGPSTADAAPELDPLARLTPTRATHGDQAPTAPANVDRVALTFPEQLTDDPPELAAAIAAAAAEVEHLDPLDDAPSFAAPAYVAAPAATAMEIEAQVPSILPAAMAATESRTVARVAAQDPLVRGALPVADVAERAPEGHDGDYTLQVISYDSRESAEAFATGLRARGHRAFVMRADVEGRGTMYRVRVGPFASAGEASQYRARFEDSEHMNTIVVRRR